MAQADETGNAVDGLLMASVMLCGAIPYRARVARSPVMDGEVVAGYIIHDPPEIIIKGGAAGRHA